MRECPFKDQCKMWEKVVSPCIPYTGARQPEVLFVGEAPGQEEDEQGANFVGKTGNLLRATQYTVGFDMSKVAFTNVVKCRPIDFKGANRTPKDGEINKCKGHVLAEIEALKPKIVVLLGSTALLGVLDEKGITNFRGRIIEKDGITYIPTWHPAAVLRDPSKEKAFAEDIYLVHQVWTTGNRQNVSQVLPVEYTLIRDMSGLKQLLVSASNATECAFDVETHPGLSPYVENAKIICVNLSFQERTAFVVPMFHSQLILQGKVLEYARAIIKEIMESNIKKCAHSAKYDIMWLEVAEGILTNNLAFDTILAQHLITGDRSTIGLDYLAWQYTDMGGYDKPLEDYKNAHKECNPKLGGSYANIPWDILFPYAAGDPDCTLRCWHVLEPKLSLPYEKLIP